MLELKYGKRKVVNYRGAKKVIGGLTTKNKIDILMHISRALASINDEKTLMKAFIELSVEIFEVDNVVIRLVQDEKLCPVEYLKETDPPRRPLDLNEGFSGKVFSSQSALFINDLKNHPEFLDEKEKTSSVLCVPIFIANLCAATASIEKETPYFYTKGDLEIFEAMAYQFGIALTQVRLMENLVKMQNELEWDLKMGRTVQQEILPGFIYPYNGIEFAAIYEPMLEVSGDYYSVVRKKDSITILMADVSGHGVPAALITMAIHHSFERLANAGLGLAEIMVELSAELKKQLPPGHYFTAQIVRVFSDYRLALVNAGHSRLMHFMAAQNEFKALDTPGIPLGIKTADKDDYPELQARLEPGDMLVMLTDGIIEQKNKDGIETGIDRFLGWLLEEREAQNKKEKFSVKALLKDAHQQWHRFLGEVSVRDDVTIMVMYQNKNTLKASERHKKARKLYDLGDTENALLAAKESLSLDNSLAKNLSLLCRIYFEMKKYSLSAQYLQQYMNISGDLSSKQLLNLGTILQLTGKKVEAKRQFKMALAANPTLSLASQRLAEIYIQDGEFAKAQRVLEQALKYNKNNRVLNQHLNKVMGAEKDGALQ